MGRHGYLCRLTYKPDKTVGGLGSVPSFASPVLDALHAHFPQCPTSLPTPTPFPGTRSAADAMASG